MKRLFVVLTILVFLTGLVCGMQSTVYFLDYETGVISEDGYDRENQSSVSGYVAEEGYEIDIEIHGAYMYKYEDASNYHWMQYVNFDGDIFGSIIGGIPRYNLRYDLPDGFDSAELKDVVVETKDLNISMFVGMEGYIDGAPAKKMVRDDEEMWPEDWFYKGFLPHDFCQLTIDDDPDTGKKSFNFRVYAGQYSYDEMTLRALTHFSCRIEYQKSVEVGGIDDDVSSPQYYTFQGLPVDCPLPGEFYVERRGDSARKIRFSGM